MYICWLNAVWMVNLWFWLICWFSGQPRRHLLQSGWSVFVSSKRLVAGDAFIFLRFDDLFSVPLVLQLYAIGFPEWGLYTFRGENGELRVGVRRAMRQQGNSPSSVISSHSMHLGVLATAWHAIQTKTMFIVYYKPRYVTWHHPLVSCPGLWDPSSRFVRV